MHTKFVRPVYGWREKLAQKHSLFAQPQTDKPVNLLPSLEILKLSHGSVGR